MKFTKSIGERRTYDMDFSGFPEVVAGERIAILGTAEEGISRAVISEPPGLTFSGVTTNGVRAQVTIAGGEAGTVYHVVFTITTNTGSVLVGDGTLKVVAD